MHSSPILLLHVSGGSIGLLSGAVALSFRKGSRVHGIAGNVFFTSMLTASAAGAYLGFRNSEMDNVFGGVLTFYLVATAWMTARRGDGETDIFDWIGLLAALAAASVTYWIEAAYSPTGTISGTPATSFVLPACVALLATAGDARMLLRGGLRGVQRIARHLWRMCFALFVATASIFLARPQLFPAFLTKTHVLFVLGILPLILLFFGSLVFDSPAHSKTPLRHLKHSLRTAEMRKSGEIPDMLGMSTYVFSRRWKVATQARFWLEWGSSDLDGETRASDGMFPATSSNHNPEKTAERHTPHSFVRN